MNSLFVEPNASRAKRVATLASLLTILSLLTAGSTEADDIRVGLGAGCTHASIASAVTAARNSAGPDTIAIASNQVYTNERHTLFGLGGQSLVIEGGWSDCNTPPTTSVERTTIDGNVSFPVFSITDSSIVRLENLELRDSGVYAVLVNGGADVDINDSVLSSSAGGLSASGNATVDLTLSFIAGNTTGPTLEGGGIRCEDATLTLNGVGIGDNRAQDGGGMWIGGGCNVTARQVEVSGNEALDDGGGIYLDGGSLETPVNTQFFAIYSNQAGDNGGGVYARDFGLLFVYNTAIVDNQAELGGGLYLTAGGFARIEADPANCFELAEGCLPLSNNSLTGTGIFGSAVFAEGTSEFYHFGGPIQGNGAEAAVSYPIYASSNSVVWLDRTEFTSNEATALVLADSNAIVLMGFVTAGDNFNSATHPAEIATVQGGADLMLHSSIFVDVEGVTLVTGGTVSQANCLMGDNLSGIPGLTASLEQAPQFVNRSALDYRLTATSDAVDYCDTSQYIPIRPTDIDGDMVGVDHPNNANGAPGISGGTYDLGWNELDPFAIFADDFESGGVLNWSSPL